jgi:hypothetical protein
MHNLPAQRNPAHQEKEDGDPQAGEETCTATLRISRAGQTSGIRRQYFREIINRTFPEKIISGNTLLDHFDIRAAIVRLPNLRLLFPGNSTFCCQW